MKRFWWKFVNIKFGS
ncbi:hypothetical protein MTR67_034964 [Solanum verrucosum]|uniref:Uncharacterized protein n=1 Tax=Solanum verrucosum TaxID=315347 RepID=A0AAF0U9I9_SOLVR|nr:hypothetical protein MTR67_034964 [Solanum verrucosum]